MIAVQISILLLGDRASSEKYVDSEAINCREVTEKQSKIELGTTLSSTFTSLKPLIM